MPPSEELPAREDDSEDADLPTLQGDDDLDPDLQEEGFDSELPEMPIEDTNDLSPDPVRIAAEESELPSQFENEASPAPSSDEAITRNDMSAQDGTLERQIVDSAANEEGANRTGLIAWIAGGVVAVIAALTAVFGRKRSK